MQNNQQPEVKVGDKLYLIPADKRHNPFEAEVDSVSRVYFTLEHISIKFYKNTLQPKEQNYGYNYPYTVYSSKKEYDELQELKRLRKLLAEKAMLLNRQTVDKLLSIIELP